MATTISTLTGVALVNTAINAGTILLPLTSQIPTRQLVIKDSYGNLASNPVTLSTQVGNSFEDGTTTKVLNTTFGSITLYAGTNVWYVLGGTSLTSQNVSSLFVSSIQGNGGNLRNLPAISTLSLNSTVQGLGSASYISSLSLLSTVAGIGSGFTGSTINLSAGTVIASLLSTLNLNVSSINGQSFGGPITSSIIGLGTLGYISSAQLLSSMTGVTNTDGSNFASTVKGLGSASYISTLSLLSTVAGIGSGFTGSTINLSAGTVIASLLSTLNLNVSSINGQSFGGPITSTSIGLGTLGYISSAQLVSSMTGVTNTNGSNFTSTVKGLGLSGYISSAQLISTTGGLIDIPELQSTIQGLGSVSYISSSQLISTTAGLLVSGSGLTLPALVSSITGLGSAGYISTAQLLSTVGGLGGAPVFLGSNISAFYVSAGFITASSVTTNFLFTSSVYFSSLSTSIINFAGGFGYLTLPDILPNTVYTSTVTASNYLVGWNAIQSPIQYFGNGSYVNSVLAEVSTGATTQELLFFRGSNAADRIRMQTTGTILFEPGVSARLWPTAPSNATPAMIINASSNVGIQTAAPGTALDVVGQIRGTTISTIQFQTSSISAYLGIRGAFVYSSFVVAPTFSTFLGGSLSTSFLTGGASQVDFRTNGLRRVTLLSSGFLGIGTTNPEFLLDVSSFTRTRGLSSMQVELSSLNGSIPILLPNLTSTVASLATGTGGGITTDQLTSSIVGLGSVGYISSTSNLLTVSTMSLQASSFGLNNALLFVSTNPVTTQKNLFLDYKAVGSYNPVMLVVSTLAACNDMFIPAEDMGKLYLITASGSGAGVNLPTADVSLNGWNFYIKNMDTSSYNLQILATTTTYLSPGVGTTVVSDGANFYCL